MTMLIENLETILMPIAIMKMYFIAIETLKSKMHMILSYLQILQRHNIFNSPAANISSLKIQHI